MSDWNWQRIVIPGSKQLNLPDFDKQVLLVEKRKDRYYGQIGSLKSLDVNGPHWSVNNDIFSQIFGDIFSAKQSYETTEFRPTHWCVIQLPKEEPETDGKSG